ncbi:MAG: isochorismatase family cysteine hydrolase [Oscillospiraceae bacterium]
MNVLVVVDMQNDFISGALGTAEAVAIVPAVAEKLARCRRAGDGIFFTRDTHTPDYLQTQEGAFLPVPHCIRGTPGWEISPALSVADATVIDKPTFGSLALAEAIAGLEGVERVTLIGVCTDICVLSNAILLKARLPETPICVDAACCAGVTPESHRNALSAMALCQVTVEG